MDSDEFVERISESCVDGAARSTISNLKRPPGSDPDADLVELSEWFRNLQPAGHGMIERIAVLAAGHAVTAFLSIIDGAKAIESGPNKGSLE